MATEDRKHDLDRCKDRVERHPDSAAAHFNLGLAYTRRGRTARAQAAYRRALEIDPDRVEAWVNLGGALMLEWDFKGCIEANREALKRKEDLVVAHYNTGQASMYLGDSEGVVHSNRRVVELEPEHAAAHYYLATGLLSLGRIDEAREAAERAQALGHSPAPEFMREMERVEGRSEAKSNPNVVTQIGVGPPKDTNRRK